MSEGKLQYSVQFGASKNHSYNSKLKKQEKNVNTLH